MEAKNIFSRAADRESWNRNTELGVDLKTFLCRDERMQTGKGYSGRLRRDSDAVVDDFFCRDAHFTFVEMAAAKSKRNPHVFEGEYITVTLRDDGSYHPNFKEMKMGKGFTIDRYALEVYRELRLAFTRLIGR
ncbi:MAG: hypothetical protein J6Z14_09905 [Prevotella sp.]|nr:hypothetical protein [Prevotella sp.]